MNAAMRRWRAAVVTARTALMTLTALATCGAAVAAGPADTARYPDRPIHLVVPWPAGGSVDIAARIVMNQVAADLGQPVVVENKPGATGNIGAATVAKAAPDGYTLLVATTPMIINRSLSPDTNIDLARDFSPVSLLVNLNYVLVVNPSVASSVQGLVAAARAKPGQISYASSGPGTQLHLLGEAFRHQAGVDIAHVPYKGAPPALTDLVGGHVQMMFPGLPVVEPFLKSGQLKALAVVARQRLPALPDVPTLAEAGIPGIDSVEWYGLVVPAGTPEAIVARLNGAIVKAMRSAGVRQQLASRGFTPAAGTAKEFGDLIQAEGRKWPVLVRQAGLRPES